MKSPTRVVFIGLLAIGLLELGVTGKFAALWQLAFASKASGPAQETTTPGPTGGEPQLHPPATTSNPPTAIF